ncbi:hypothetical protein JR316_0009043 [Psilocybe cubensis]|uniref:Uncharacterized protein n=1 Tax=Psilocybe cubensis TaxID=181762 RepID=A0ACB8GTN2_PSICU|nr:hypothetical protein JR316_0009043 [Psilocybe cubensis]KAH9478586.1 hypothetical protein JR316_0009043 [Psilocybe cubensis]
MATAVATHENVSEEQIFIYNCVLCASFIILYYDYLLTFPDEIDFYWRPKFNFALGFILFFVNRYVVTLGHIPVILFYFWNWSAVPDRFQVIIGIISIIRTWALFQQSRRVLATLCILAIGVIVFGNAMVVEQKITETQTKSVLLSVGCILPHPDKRVMVLASTSVIMSFYLLPSYIRGITATLTNILSSSMISRLMINLRDPSSGSSYWSRYHDQTLMSTLFFGPGISGLTEISDTSTYEDTKEMDDTQYSEEPGTY